MDKLAEILVNKQFEIARFRAEGIKPLPREEKKRFLVRKKLEETETVFVIAEVKRKSPSRGEMAMEMDPVELALEYKEGGADMISVLTDERYFGGSFDFLREVKEATGLPILCKDFILDEVQIERAAFFGADMVLLIAEALPNTERLCELYQFATSLGLDVLVEVHERENALRIARCEPLIIGVNNRNLRTLTEDWQHSREMVDVLPKQAYRFSLSAISRKEQIECLVEWGYDGILVGTSLVTNPARKECLAQWKEIHRRR